MIRLGVNVDHVATVREARKGQEPDPVTAALLSELAGANQITIHLREDRRHIQDRDLKILREVGKTRLNLEMVITDEVVEIALATCPEQVTFVPEKRQEVTTEGGLDVLSQLSRVTEAVGRFNEEAIKVSLFIDPSPEQVEAAAESGADMVEFHTGEYANAHSEQEIFETLENLRACCKLSAEKGLAVCAGHGLNYQNIAAIREIPEIEEVNIGHSIISRAIFVGIEQAVRQMKQLLR